MPVAVVADAQSPGRRALLHARRDVHRGAADAALGIDAAAEQHRPGVDARADVELGDAVTLPHRHREAFGVADDAEGGVDRALDVVLVRFFRPERREHAVAGVLQHAAVVRLHDRGEALERAVHHRMDLFRAELLADRRRADDVDEQHRDLLQLLDGGRFTAVEGGELAPQRRQRDVDHRIAEDARAAPPARRWWT